MRLQMIILLIAGILFSWSSVAWTSMSETGQKGKEIPFFQLKDVKGNDVGSEVIKKESFVVVLNFWGLRCGDCVAEIPFLNRILEKYHEKGVRVWAINMDGVNGEILSGHAARYPVPPSYNLIADQEFKTIELFNVMAAPQTFVISPQGRILYEHEGFQEGDEKKLEDAIIEILAGKE